MDKVNLMKSRQDIINLFWTGGWDSTFRLLQILFIEKKPVQTYYIIDKHRRSLANELETIFKITHALLTGDEHTRSLLLPPHISMMIHIKPDQEITRAFHAALEKKVISTQYEYMARFCKQHRIKDMEVCIEKVANPKSEPRFDPFLRRIGESPEFTLRDDMIDEPEYVLLSNFCFPIFGYTKMAMAEEAKELGCQQIMDMTWFCQKPIQHKYPCGNCIPCKQSILEGLGYRIPFRNRLSGRVKQSKFFAYLKPMAAYLDKRRK